MKTVIKEKEIKEKAKGGRPKKNICRSVVLTVRMTTTERTIIERKAKAAGMKTTEWFRSAAQSARVTAQFTPEEIAWMRSLAGACNNLNQFVKLAHIHGLSVLADAGRSVLFKVSSYIDKLNQDGRQTD